MFKFFAILFIVAAIGQPVLSADGSLSLSAKNSAALGETFSVNIAARSAGVLANAVGVNVSFSRDLVDFVSVSGPTIISLSVNKGLNDKGEVTIEGGIWPAKILNNDPIATITFRARQTGTANFSITSGSSLYADDGRGSSIPVVLGTTQVNIIQGQEKPITPSTNTNSAAETQPPSPVWPITQPETTAALNSLSWLENNANWFIVISLGIILSLGIFVFWKETIEKKRFK